MKDLFYSGISLAVCLLFNLFISSRFLLSGFVHFIRGICENFANQKQTQWLSDLNNYAAFPICSVLYRPKPFESIIAYALESKSDADK